MAVSCRRSVSPIATKNKCKEALMFKSKLAQLLKNRKCRSSTNSQINKKGRIAIQITTEIKKVTSELNL